MNFRQLNEELEKLLTLNEGNFYTKLPFSDFRLKCLQRYELKIKKLPYEYQDTALVKHINNIDIYDTCIEHVYRDHNDMDNDKWEVFLSTFNPKIDIQEKAKHNGKNGERYVYKCNNNSNYFGYVLDLYPNKSPRLVTVFEGHPNSVDNWFNNVVMGNITIQ